MQVTWNNFANGNEELIQSLSQINAMKCTFSAVLKGINCCAAARLNLYNVLLNINARVTFISNKAKNYKWTNELKHNPFSIFLSISFNNIPFQDLKMVNHNVFKILLGWLGFLGNFFC